MLFKKDPGPCPVDDAPHTTCTSPDYTGAGLAITQLPNRDGEAPTPLVGAVKVPLLVGQLIQQSLEPPAVTTAAYGQMTKRTMKRKPR
jgi:hypothetical protein